MNTEQTSLPANSMTSANILQQHAGADDADRTALEARTAGASGTVVAGKDVLMALHGCCVETSRMVVEQGMNAEPVAEEALRQSRDELRKLSAQLLAIQENERRRIAADLHDGIGQSMSLIKMSMESVARLINAGSHQEAAESLQQMIRKVKDAMTELRCITTELRPSMLDDLGIVSTLAWFFREYESAWNDKEIEKDIRVEEDDVPLALKTTIFRILQEAMNNIAKHANAQRIRVSLKKNNGAIEFFIEDNGAGFDLEGMLNRLGASRGMGLLTMNERARSSGGIFEMRSTPGGGTRILVVWPNPDGADGFDDEMPGDVYARQAAGQAVLAF